MSAEQSEQQAATEDGDAILEHDAKGPGVKLPPPLVFTVALLVSALLQASWPVGLSDLAMIRYLGVALCVSSIIALLDMVLMFRRHKTSIKPWKPTAQVLSHGPYAFSRNPIYLGFCFLAVGIGLVLNSLWMTLSFIPAAFIVLHTAILKEEKYLENKFGEEYRHYKKRVRRWL